MTKAAEVIELLGGSKAVADALKVHRNTVIKWKVEGVSGVSLMPFMDLCKKYGVKVTITDIARMKK